MNEIDAMLTAAETDTAEPDNKEAFEIQICNKLTGATEPAPVYPGNTLGQIAEGYGSLIGIKAANKKLIFYNESVTPKRSTSDQSITVQQFSLTAGSTLGISDEGSVA